MRAVLAITVIALSLSACNSGSRSAGLRNNAARFNEDEQHRLYSAALAANESPLDTETFKEVCQTIGIFDVRGQPNDQYMTFVSRHVDWGSKPETIQFRQEINSKEKAREYLRQHLSAR